MNHHTAVLFINGALSALAVLFNVVLSAGLLDQYYVMGLCLLGVLVNGALSASQALMGALSADLLDQYYLWKK